MQQDYARYTYSANGQRLSVRDANDNRSEYTYDGFDRLGRLTFPSTTLGANAVNAADYEQYGYDPNGNRTSLRLRSSETIAYHYDNLNRECFKDMPSLVADPASCGNAVVGATASDVFSDYDLAGRRLSSRFGSGSGQGIIYSYDTAGRLASETTTIGTSRALSYQYDIASNRTRITWPDSTYANYTYDALNRVDLVQENGTTTLADYAYDTQARRQSITRGNGAVTTYGYDTASRLNALNQNLDGAATANDQTLGFAYTAASQISQRTASNDNFNWAGSSITRGYNRNGLNQYTSTTGSGAASFNYDTRGNFINDGSRRFCYDLENRLTAVAPVATDPCITASTMALGYDPLGRLRQTSASSVTTDFLYDGDRLVAEYNGATLLRRYVHGPGVDEPLVWYEGSGTSDRRYLVTDHQGSVIAANGATTTRYSYGPYGEPNSWSGSRFRYTGQIILDPDLNTATPVGFYHYKARVYWAEGGRFLQTDPVGYGAGDLNLYAYVGNNPLNASDPSGMDIVCDNEDPPNCRETIDLVITAERRELSAQEFSDIRRAYSNQLARDAAVNYVAPAVIAGAGGAIIAIGARGAGVVIALGDDVAAGLGAIGSSPTARGAAGNAAADLVGQAVDPSRTGSVDLAQTGRAAVVGAIAGGAVGRTAGLQNQVLVGGTLVAAGTPFIEPGSTLQDQLIAGAMGAATTTANTVQSLGAAIGESLFGHPRERR